jgi:hypothetical protein
MCCVCGIMCYVCGIMFCVCGIMRSMAPIMEEYSDLSSSMPILMDWIGVRRLWAMLSVQQNTECAVNLIHKRESRSIWRGGMWRRVENSINS